MQMPGDDTDRLYGILTDIMKLSPPHNTAVVPYIKPKKDFDWDNIEIHIDAAVLEEEQTLIMTMADLNSQTKLSSPCTFRDFDLNTLHQQINIETGIPFDTNRFELQWQNGNDNEAFSVNRPGRYKVMLKRFSQKSEIPHAEHILHLHVAMVTAPSYTAAHRDHGVNTNQTISNLHFSDTDAGSDYSESDHEDYIHFNPPTISEPEIEQLIADQGLDVSLVVPEAYHSTSLNVDPGTTWEIGIPKR